MQIKEKNGELIVTHKAKEQMSWKKCYMLCQAELVKLLNNKDIEHIRCVAEMLNRRIKSYDKRISLYKSMIISIEKAGLQRDTTLFNGGDGE